MIVQGLLVTAGGLTGYVAHWWQIRRRDYRRRIIQRALDYGIRRSYGR